MSRHTNQLGVAHLVLLAVVAMVAAVIGFSVWRIQSNKADKPVADKTSSANKSQSGDDGNMASQVEWMWDGSSWKASSSAPDCDDPVRFDQVPVDTEKVSGILYPGQVRGGNYKPHGGFKLNGTSNKADVKAIMDGYVVSGARYIESGEVQYMFTIVNNCGIAYRFDHMLTLSPAFQKIADNFPEPKKDDSRTTNVTSNNYVKKGDVVATGVGFKNTSNYTFDLGVYDYRSQNEAAKSGKLKGTGLPDLSQSGYALCWLDMFDSVDYRSYPAVDEKAGKTSDYCL